MGAIYVFTDDDGQRWQIWLRPGEASTWGKKVGDLRRKKQQEADGFRESGDERSARALESLTLHQWLHHHGAVQRAERR